MSRADRKSQVRQCLGFCTPDFWSLFAYESAEEKPKHCLTWDFLSALLMSYLVSSVFGAEWRRPPRLSWRPPPCSGGWAAGRRCSSWPETRGITQGSLIDSHWQKSQFRRYFGCCTADSQADEDQQQLNNNKKIYELETFDNDCSLITNISYIIICYWSMTDLDQLIIDYRLSADLRASSRLPTWRPIPLPWWNSPRASTSCRERR